MMGTSKLGVRYQAIVPAAGRARRMGSQSCPKQYLALADRAVIEWSLAPLLADPACERLVVVLAPGDAHWMRLPVAGHAKIVLAVGGGERVDSVRAGLEALRAHARERDWIVVHDAARPCLSRSDLQCLVETLYDDEIGGLLATPVVDTLKRVGEGLRVERTVARTGLWRALTPQMFRYGLLVRALARSLIQGAGGQPAPVTDEAQAIEAMGFSPRVVAGDPDNIKITLPEDLLRAGRILAAARAGAGPKQA